MPSPAQDIPRVGSPYVQQYKKIEYKAGNQNWGLSVDPVDGVVYAANTGGLLRFDGQQWRLFKSKGNGQLRSVYAADDGKIYSGGQGEFGYWTKKGFGVLEYTSLTHLVKDRNALQNDDIWRILIVDDAVYFHSFSKTYVYRGDGIETITAAFEPFLFSHYVNGNVYLEQIPSGLHRYDRGQLIPLREREMLYGKQIMSMLSLGNDILIATAKDGLYLLDQSGTISRWNTSANSLFTRYQINAGVKVSEDLYAFGTIQNGVIIVNSVGELVQHINKNNGLQNNTVLGLTVDKQQNLWVGLDNGIDRIDLFSPFYFYSDLSGSLGTVYTSTIHRNKLYLGTNQGLFVSEWPGTKRYAQFDFKLVPHSEGQVWQLIDIDGLLYCGHNNGTYQVDGDRLIPVSSITGGWTFYPIFNTEYLLQGNYTGISLFSTSAKPMQHIRQLQRVRDPIKFIAAKNQTEYWIGNNSTFKRLKLDRDLSGSNHLETVVTGLPSARLHGVYPLRGGLVFASDSGFYRFDDVINSFRRYDEFNEQLGSFANANKLIAIDDQQAWIIKQSQLAKISWAEDGSLSVDSTIWAPLRGKMMAEHENILPIEQGIDLIGLDNGFALFNSHVQTAERAVVPIINGFWNTTHEVDAISPETPIPYNTNNIRIAYALPWYTSGPVQYQYRLRGYSDEWSEWSEVGIRDFTNLPFGDHTFEVRAKIPSGEVSEATAFEFTILRPWYASWIALIFYLLLIVVIYAVVRHWSNRKVLAEQEQLRKKLLEEKQEALHREAEANERRMMVLRNEKLEHELAVKNRELANAATNIMYKNEMLNTLHDELTKIKDANGNKLKPEQLRKVNNLIDEAHNDTRDWDLFEKSFNEAHEDFFKKLKAEYPSLVPNDLKLCAYLRLNMSSKEIASLLNISLRGVEIRRYRLRKKVNIPKEKNLSEFMLEL